MNILYFKLSLILTINLVVTHSLFAQNDHLFSLHKMPTHVDTIFYPFYDGVQMIEIDHLSFWDKKIFFLEQSQPRGMPHSTTEGPPLPNVYLFRNDAGKIIRAFNTLRTLKQLNTDFKDIPINKKSTHLQHRMMPYHASKSIFSKGIWTYSIKSAYFFNGFYKVFQNPIHNSFPGDPLKEEHKVVALIDSLGNFKIPYKYLEFIPLGEHLLALDSLKQWNIIDKNEQAITTIKFDQYRWEDQNILSLIKNDKIVGLYFINSAKLVEMNAYDKIHNINRIKTNPITPIIKNGKWGFLDSSLTEIVVPQYEVCEYFQSPYGLGRIFKNGKWGFIDQSAQEVIPCIYEHAERFSRAGYSTVIVDNKRFCIDKNGAIAKDCQVSRTWKSTAQSILGYQVVMRRDNNCNYHGLMDVGNNKIIVPIIYRGLYKNKLEPFIRIKKDQKVGIMDTTFKEVLACEYYRIQPFTNEHAIVITSNNRIQKYGLINQDFDLVLKPVYEALYFDQSQRLVFKKDGKYGIMNANLEILLPNHYDEVMGFNTFGYTRVLLDSLVGFYDTLAQLVIPIQYKYHSIGYQIKNNRIWFKKNNKIGFLNEKGEVIIDNQYDEVQDFEKEITAVSVEGKWHFINLFGTRLSPATFDFVHYSWYGNTYKKVQRNEKYGMVDIKGQLVIPCIYDDFWGYSPKLGFTVELDGKRFRIDTKGQRVN